MTDIQAMLDSLDLERVDSVPELDAFVASHESDAPTSAFWSSLLADAGLHEGKLKSRLGRSIDLYHDAIARHAASRAIAFSALDARGDFQHLSFAELDASATACATEWSLAGLHEGDVLALVAPLGVTWLVAFAAALRLGLTISCLAPRGEASLCRRLRVLDPKRVVFDGPQPVPTEFAERGLTVARSSRAHAPPPRAYAPEQELAKIFSPLRAKEEPTPLLAQSALLLGLRDARFAYRIGAGSGIAAPGLWLEQHQPALILATLLSGARFVELPVSAVAQRPARLAEPFVTSLGVSPALREVLRRAPLGSLPALRDWWRSVDEPLDWESWRDFIEKNGMNELPAASLLVDAASGGALLISARRPGVANAFVVPSPGAPFVLEDIGSGAPAATGVGVFNDVDAEQPGWFLLAKRASEYLYGGTLRPRRAGRVFPAREVIECAAELPYVDGACVVPVAGGEPGPRWLFVLVVFAPRLSERDRIALTRLVERTIETRLGIDFMPDRTEVVALYPRRDGRKLDLEWCRRQYFAGFLERKADLPIFQRLTALRAALRSHQDDVR